MIVECQFVIIKIMDAEKRFTDNARMAVLQAEVLAHLSQSSLIETSHLLLAIANQENSIGAKVLRDFNLDIATLRREVDIKPGVVVAGGTSMMRLSRAMELTMEMAMALAKEMRQGRCGTAHILYAILSQRRSRAVKLLSDQQIDIDKLSGELAKYLDGSSMPDEGFELDEDAQEESWRSRFSPGRDGGSATTILGTYSTDLTKSAKDGKLDPVIGRDQEIDRLITIVSRRTKNNPILIGEAGVGKTAVVEGLAQRIASGKVPDFLSNRRVLEVDLAAMVAGTKYRGQFEERLKSLIKEAEKDDRVILFIDEVHLVVGTGAAEGSMDAANLLKPALARGKIHLIGATTNDEYRKYIEKDAALTRRMQPVTIDQPSTKDTVRILTGLAPKYEEYHHVRVSKAVIDEIVRLSERYLTERQQPDKAIDVLDETAARVHVANANSDVANELRDCQSEIGKLTTDMEKAVSEEDYEHAALYKMRISQLKEKVETLQSSQTEAGYATIKLNDVAATVSRMTGVPLEQLKRSEITKLVNLEKRLSKRVIGQDQAVSVVSQAIRRSRAGISDPNRPIGSFIFLGPTGVGKTELARVLADEVFGSSDSLIKVDMSEFSERHTVSRLVGAPAGYVGYDDGGQLTERVRRQPYSVVLFDEIEKAHPDVFNVLLQILEDGVLTDGHGKRVDFRNCVIILTSNIGAAEMANDVVGFTVSRDEQSESLADDRKEVVMKALRSSIRPELLNRFDQIVMFNSLGQKEISPIFDLLLDDLNKRLSGKGMAMMVSPKLKRWLIERGYDSKMGARPLRRTIQNELERVVADQIIGGKLRRGDIVRADLKGNKVVLVQQSERASSRRPTVKVS